MRSKLHPTLDYCRTHGEGLNGAFCIPGPKGDRLSIISSDGSDWKDPAPGYPEGLPGPAWEHVSVKVTFGDKAKAWKTPSWQEMCFVKDLFWDEEEWVVQFHPAVSDYVNDHPMVLHLWRCKDGFPMPPKACV